MNQRDLFAWVTRMPDGRWSLVGTWTIDTGHLALVSHDAAAMERARAVAVNHGKALRQRVELVRWHAIETLEGIDP